MYLNHKPVRSVEKERSPPRPGMAGAELELGDMVCSAYRLALAIEAFLIPAGIGDPATWLPMAADLRRWASELDRIAQLDRI